MRKTLQDFPNFKIEDIEIEIKKLEVQGIKVENIIGDVEEQLIKRIIANQEEKYSGKKKRHTTKNQVIVVEEMKRIINIYNANDVTHDYKMVQDSGILPILERLSIGGKIDSGYQGIQKELTKALIPKKKSELHGSF